jgi:hypothetical protein
MHGSRSPDVGETARVVAPHESERILIDEGCPMVVPWSHGVCAWADGPESRLELVVEVVVDRSAQQCERVDRLEAGVEHDLGGAREQRRRANDLCALGTSLGEGGGEFVAGGHVQVIDEHE